MSSISVASLVAILLVALLVASSFASLEVACHFPVSSSSADLFLASPVLLVVVVFPSDSFNVSSVSAISSTMSSAVIVPVVVDLSFGVSSSLVLVVVGHNESLMATAIMLCVTGVLAV